MKDTWKKNKILQKKTKKTRKKRSVEICGNIISKKEGWIVLKIYGAAFERGFAHGHLLKNELKKVMYSLPFLVKKTLKTNMTTYLDTCKKEISPIVEKSFNEFYLELSGISAGAKSNGLTISVDYLIAWNSFLSLGGYFTKAKAKTGDSKDEPTHCSAFIAVGDATENKGIVMAHATHCDIVSASMFNIVLYVTPIEGFEFCIQTCAGYIASGADFFLSSSGIIGSETTISYINYKQKFKGNYPYFCRIRKAIQYGKTLDDYSRIMLYKNSGDYANSWLFGDTNTNEIMLCEIGLKFHNIEKTKNGVFYGMNSAIGAELRKNETNDIWHTDVSRSSGSRGARMNYLLNDKFYGRINSDSARLIIADHYDIFTASDNPGSRSICNHDYNKPPFYPWIAVDAKVCTTSLAKKMRFNGIFGSSCGTAFDKEKYIKQNPMYNDWKPYLRDLPRTQWIFIKQS